MPETKNRPVLDEIDQDLRVACLDRAKAYRRMKVKDSTANREAWEDACAEVDELLEMRHQMTHTAAAD